MKLKRLFDGDALRYDRNRRQVIPCFDEFYGTLIRIIPFRSDETFRFLDLGAGTGLVSAMILNVFPDAEGSLLDISEAMLERARERFSERKNISFHVMDYDTSDLPDKYDLIASAMSIHHLSHAGKRDLFQKIYHALNPGGAFVHAELARGATESAEQIYQEHWRNHLNQIGLSQQELDLIYQRMAYDRPAPLEDQLKWLKEAGFIDIDCFYKYYNFAVYMGRKQAL